VFFARFVALLRIFGSLMAGVAHMPFLTFSAVNLAGGFVWAATFSVIGLVFGKNVSRLDDYIQQITIGVTVIVIGAIIVYWWREKQGGRSSLS
jgi:membrane protein DedA with SNARE-associated domain